MVNQTASVDFSIVIPFLNEAAVLPLLQQRLESVQGLPDSREFVFVSDGSTDESAAIIERWAARDKRVKLLVLTRNFGHQAAISAGLDYSRGKFVGIMDADLQDPPETMVQMYKLADEEDWDIVYSVRAKRAGFWLKLAGYRLFYKMYERLAESPVNPDSGDFSVLSRRAVETLLSFPETVRFVRGLRSWTGLRATSVQTERPDREAGEPQYSWRKLLGLAIDGLVSFSARPLRLATLAGALLCAGAFALSIVYLAALFLYGTHSKVPGFTTIVILLLFLNGVQFLMLGIIGEYIAQIFKEVKRRPTYIVDRALNVDRPAS